MEVIGGVLVAAAGFGVAVGIVYWAVKKFSPRS